MKTNANAFHAFTPAAPSTQFPPALVLPINRSLIDPDQPQTIDHYDQSTFDRFLKPRIERRFCGEPSFIRTIVLPLNQKSKIKNQKSNQSTFLSQLPATANSARFPKNQKSKIRNQKSSILSPPVTPSTITKPLLYLVCTANPQISKMPFPSLPSLPSVTVSSASARDFHASKMLTSAPRNRLALVNGTFTKPLLYRRILICTAKSYFFRETRFAPFCLTSETPDHQDQSTMDRFLKLDRRTPNLKTFEPENLPSSHAKTPAIPPIPPNSTSTRTANHANTDATKPVFEYSAPMARSDPTGPFIKLSAPETEEFWKVPVLFEDDDLFALDKPARLLTSPDRYDANRPNLMRILHRDIERGAPWAAERKLTYLSNAHRLDFETSGVLLLAKNKSALVALADEFGGSRAEKTYVTLVQGTPEMDAFSSEAKLAPHPVKLGLMRVDPKRGKKSQTNFTVLEKFIGYTLIRCAPLTGRTHQIRVHLAHGDLPIVGDETYGGTPLMLSQLKRDYRPSRDGRELPLMGRLALHAETLTIAHPVTKAATKIESPWPRDMEVTLKYLRKFAAA